MAALSTFGGHPAAAAVALANIDLMEREQLCADVRYRIRRVEELTGRSPAGPRDRIEFWPALRGREPAL
jgi:adenosylmethionine-8-amino-7-oxononanoate aminotransferase